MSNPQTDHTDPPTPPAVSNPMEAALSSSTDMWQRFRDLNVLIVDDSRAIRIFLESMLSERGAVVQEAVSGEQALARLAERRFELVLLDLVLPDLDGLSVLERMRATDTETPVVVITGAGGIRSATEALHHGADGYIEKQHLQSADGEESTAFLHALQQAMQNREGIVARAQLERVKTEFYSMVTHDLRNPAGSVWGVVRMLLSGKAGPLTEKQEQLLQIAQTSSGKLVGLINDYLDYSKIEAGYLRVEQSETDLCALLAECTLAADLQAELRHQELRLELPDRPVLAMVDRERVAQVVDNLLSNAIKYTPEGGSLRISLHHAGEQVEFRVSDTGAGIPPEQIDRLFTAYHRVPGEATRNIRGTGLGLLVVKEIVEAHGGTVHAESAGIPGQGTTFVVRLPAAGGER